jgi:hypothetical protein
MTKMQQTDNDVDAFLEAVPNGQRRADARKLCSHRGAHTSSSI